MELTSLREEFNAKNAHLQGKILLIVAQLIHTSTGLDTSP